MSTPFKEAVKSHLDTHSLSDHQLEQLGSFVNEERRQNFSTSNNRSRYKWLISLATVGLALIFVLLITPERFDASSISESVAADVAENHINLKPAEIETNNMEDIRQFFDRLNFLPTRSQLINPGEWELIGGRYCSIQSISAAQLRIRNVQTQKLQTFYQVPYDEKLFQNAFPDLTAGEQPLQVSSRGLAIKIWLEDEFLYAMTDE